MVEIKISAGIRKKAELAARKIKPLRNSILRGKGNIYGEIGERIVAEFLGARKVQSYDFDLKKNKTRLEVKTKTCSTEPKPEYECSVSGSSYRQEHDYFVFGRVHDEMKRAWLLGAISRKCFFKYARFCKEGEIDVKSNRNWRFKADCWNISIDRLIPIERFLKVRKL